MNFDLIFLPLAAQVFLTLGLLGWLGFSRVRAVQAKDVHIKDVALSSDKWPIEIRQIGNCYRNQFELPLLFYLICVLSYISVIADTLFVVLAWCYVLTRYVHAYIHVTSNRVSMRFYAFLAGVAILFLMWLIFTGKILYGLI